MAVGVILLVASPSVVAHFDGAISTSFDTKWVLLIGLTITSIMSIFILYLAKHKRKESNLLDFPGILQYEGYYLGELGLAIAMFVGLMFDKVRITTFLLK